MIGLDATIGAERIDERIDVNRLGLLGLLLILCGEIQNHILIHLDGLHRAIYCDQTI